MGVFCPNRKVPGGSELTVLDTSVAHGEVITSKPEAPGVTITQTSVGFLHLL